MSKILPENVQVDIIVDPYSITVDIEEFTPVERGCGVRGALNAKTR